MPAEHEMMHVALPDRVARERLRDGLGRDQDRLAVVLALDFPLEIGGAQIVQGDRRAVTCGGGGAVTGMVD